MLSRDPHDIRVANKILRARFVVVIALSTVFGGCAVAQQPEFPAEPVPSLPSSAPQDQTPGTLQGVITDPDGEAIDGAQVTLSGDTIPIPRQTLTDDDGRFQFLNVPPGRFTLSAASQGFGAVQTAGTLLPGQDSVLRDIALPVMTAKTDVQVTLTLHDEAEAEIKDEETQRLAGIFPNFYVTYNWHAAPLTTTQKYKLAVHTILDPVNNGVDLAIAGIQQGTNSLAGYGPGPAGYGKRFGADTADFYIGAMLGGAVLPSLFHQDPRYFYKGFGTVRSRVFYAIAAAVICRGDNGHWQPNYSSVLGDFAAGAASNLYYPPGSRTGLSLTLEDGLLQTGEDAVGNLVQEFFFRHLTPHAPTYVKVMTTP